MHRAMCLALLLIGGSAQAALINYGLFSTDTDSSLDWLHLDQTDGMTMSVALAANSGWRYADYAEIENLYATVFPGIPNPADLGYTNIYGNSPQQQVSSANFLDNFGVTGIQGSLVKSQGLYFGEGDAVFLLGVQIYTGQYAQGYSHIYMDYTEYGYSNPSFSYPEAGTFLVRATAVPVPTAVWLFGSALAMLGWLRVSRGRNLGTGTISRVPMVTL
jgi:hypothetical protein